jgi:hypothetical protein
MAFPGLPCRFALPPPLFFPAPGPLQRQVNQFWHMSGQFGEVGTALPAFLGLGRWSRLSSAPLSKAGARHRDLGPPEGSCQRPCPMYERRKRLLLRPHQRHQWTASRPNPFLLSQSPIRSGYERCTAFGTELPRKRGRYVPAKIIRMSPLSSPMTTTRNQTNHSPPDAVDTHPAPNAPPPAKKAAESRFRRSPPALTAPLRRTRPTSAFLAVKPHAPTSPSPCPCRGP